MERDNSNQGRQNKMELVHCTGSHRNRGKVVQEQYLSGMLESDLGTGEQGHFGIENPDSASYWSIDSYPGSI